MFILRHSVENAPGKINVFITSCKISHNIMIDLTILLHLQSLKAYLQNDITYLSFL